MLLLPAGQMLGSSMMEPLDHVLARQDKTTSAAERMADLLNAREATAQVGVAAATATLAAAVAVAPATVRMPSALPSTCKAAVTAVTELNAVAEAAQKKQEQLQQRLQQQLDATTNRHYQLQLGHKPDSPRGQQQQQQSQAASAAARHGGSTASFSNSSISSSNTTSQQQADLLQTSCPAAGKGKSRSPSPERPSQGLSVADAGPQHSLPDDHGDVGDEQHECSATTALQTAEEQPRHHELSSLYGLALAASVCMADLIRQVSCKKWSDNS